MPPFDDERPGRLAREQLGEAFARIGDQFLALDHEWRYVFANDRVLEVTGRSRDELVGRSIWELFPDVAGSAFERELRGVVARQQPSRFEFFHAATGRWFENHAYPSRSGLTLLVVDITDRRRAEIERDRVFELSLDLLAVASTRDGRWKRVNPAFERVLGWSADELYAMPYFEIVHPDDLERSRRATEGLARGEPLAHFQQRVLTKNGRYRWIAWNTSADPAAGLMYCVGRDITDRWQAEEALRASEERYRAIVEVQSEMVCRFRLDGTILFVNGAYARARGASPEALVGVNLWDWVAEADRPAVRALLERLTPDAPEVRVENRFETAEGTRWTLWTNRGLVFDQRGRALELQSTGIDITDRRRAEEALREADRRKDEFLATLAHELRNPLAPLRTGLEILRRMREDPEASERALGVMERQVGQMVRLIDDLLDVSRISRGAITLRRERLDLAAVLQQALETGRPAIDAAGHALALALPAEPVPLDGDPTRLAQVFANLLHNAAKFTPPGGRIELSAARAGDAAVEVRVRDSGVGIKPEMLPRIFEMFAQADPGPESARGGLGIGLSLVRQLVELHGGSVAAESAGAWRGSTFVVRLPLAPVATAAPAASAATGATAATAAPRGATGASAREPRRAEAPAGRAARRAEVPARRILVADDNRDAALSLALLLGEMGNQTRTAHDGVEALEAAAAFRPDVVLLDIGMPRLDGYETARRIRQQPWGRDVTLVAITGWGQPGDRARSREAGFDAHLVKPVDPAALERLLAS